MSRDKTPLEIFNDSLKELREITNVDPDTLTDVASEAMTHIIEHFNVPKEPKHDQDFCLVVFNTYLGESKDSDSPVMASGIYTAGNLDKMAHSLAFLMAFDPVINQLMHHIMHAYQMNHSKRR